jgi:hypothetical protein
MTWSDKTLLGIFLSIEHHNFMVWYVEYYTISCRQKHFKTILFRRHRMMFNRSRHDIIVSARQKYVNRCLRDQATYVTVDRQYAIDSSLYIFVIILEVEQIERIKDL